jgi:hypothetical protein
VKRPPAKPKAPPPGSRFAGTHPRYGQVRVDADGHRLVRVLGNTFRLPKPPEPKL